MTHFLLTNTHGYVALGAPNGSNYHGYYVKHGETYAKVLANVLPAGKLKNVKVGKTVEREFTDGKQRISLHDEGLLMSCQGTFTLTLDCKELFDESDTERTYEIDVKNAPAKSSGDKLGSMSIVKVQYPKHNLHVHIATTMGLDIIEKWRHITYWYDERRETHSTPYVFDLGTLTGEGLVAVVAGNDPKRLEKDVFSLLLKKHTEGEFSLEDALRSLKTETGIMAGLPWFHQEWSRDELIACGGLLALNEYEDVVQILDKWYKSVRSDGTLPAMYPDEGLTSVDAPGWLAKRTLDVIGSVDIDPEKIRVWRDALDKMLIGLPVQDGLVRNDTNETWMDTEWEDDGRSGARIEVQALAMTLCDAHATLNAMLGAPPQWKKMRDDIDEAVHERLVVDDMLRDGLNADGSVDLALRPNIFLAWYVQPDLFTKSDWKRFFLHALEHLWLDWGGLSSISQQDSRFCPHDTGEDTRAYHRGDSWYYMNNIAALALKSVGGFSDYVTKIRAASLADLEQGFVGHASEISSANNQEPMGCWAQAWSISTLLELR